MVMVVSLVMRWAWEKHVRYVHVYELWYYRTIGSRFNSHSGRDWKTLTGSSTVNGYLTIVWEGLLRRLENSHG